MNDLWAYPASMEVVERMGFEQFGPAFLSADTVYEGEPQFVRPSRFFDALVFCAEDVGHLRNLSNQN